MVAETAPVINTTQQNSPGEAGKKHPFPIILIAFILVAGILVLAVLTIGRKGSSPSTISADQAVMKVGDETIYQKDIDYNLATFYPGEATKAATLQKAKKLVQDKIAEESIILQEGKKMGIATLSEKVFNNVNKNIVERNKLITSITEKVSTQNVSMISGASINIWFHNQSYPPPKMGYANAKVIAKQKMDAIYADLKSKKITFTQAADQIFNDKSLAEIDPNYQGNGAVGFKNRIQSEKPFNSEKANQVAWSLHPGEISQVLLINDDRNNKGHREEFEAFYKIIYITAKNAAKYATFDEWYLAKKQTYAITLY